LAAKGLEPTQSEFETAAIELRMSKGLTSGGKVAQWLREAGLRHSDYNELIRRYALLKKVRVRFAHRINLEKQRLARAQLRPG
jgi:hypothetical protein